MLLRMEDELQTTNNTTLCQRSGVALRAATGQRQCFGRRLILSVARGTLEGATRREG